MVRPSSNMRSRPCRGPRSKAGRCDGNRGDHGTAGPARCDVRRAAHPERTLRGVEVERRVRRRRNRGALRSTSSIGSTVSRSPAPRVPRVPPSRNPHTVRREREGTGVPDHLRRVRPDSRCVTARDTPRLPALHPLQTARTERLASTAPTTDTLANTAPTTDTLANTARTTAHPRAKLAAEQTIPSRPSDSEPYRRRTAAIPITAKNIVARAI
jgi:hypothetical protein